MKIMKMTIESVDIVIMGFLLFLFGLFAVTIYTSAQENKNTSIKLVSMRCELAFSMATSQSDSVMVNIANPVCQTPTIRSGYGVEK